MFDGIQQGEVDFFADEYWRRGWNPRNVHAWRCDHVQWAEGGNFVRMRGPKRMAFGHRGEGDKILEFSRASRRRLLEFVNSIDRELIKDVSRLWFVTLTYPRVWPTDAREWKRHLDVLGKRVRRFWGEVPAIWKLEAQKRGAPHYHLIMLVSPEMSGKLDEMRQWLSRAWYEIVNSGDERHLRAGTQIVPVRSWNGVSHYAAQYMGKVSGFIHPSLVDENGEPKGVGRFWGVWNKSGWPLRILSGRVPESASVEIRRHVRRYQERRLGRRLLYLRGRCTAFRAYMPSEDFKRIVCMVLSNWGKRPGDKDWDAFQAWEHRRGRPEQIDPYQIRQDFLSQCGAEYSEYKNRGGIMVEIGDMTSDEDSCPVCGHRGDGATDHCPSCGWSVSADAW